jgi:hypothetical protein
MKKDLVEKTLYLRFKKRLFGIRKKAKGVGWEFEET